MSDIKMRQMFHHFYFLSRILRKPGAALFANDVQRAMSKTIALQETKWRAIYFARLTP